MANSIHRLAEDGKLEALEKLQEQGVDVDYEDIDGNTCLQIAASYGHYSVVESLLKCGADINAKNGYGCTALMQAVRASRSHVSSYLLKHGASVNDVNALGVSVLALATASGNIGVVRSLMDAEADENLGQLSPVKVAILMDDEVMVRVLLNRGTSVNATFHRTGVTPLMVAAYQNDVKYVKTLLSRGAQPNAMTANNTTALSIAQEHDCKEAIDILTPVTEVIRSDVAVSALEAVDTNDLQTLLMILQKDPKEAKAVNEQGMTALHAACMLGSDRAVQMLLDHGADINAVDRVKGWSPLLYATSYGHIGIIEYLLRCGADSGIITPSGLNLLDCAEQTNDFDVIKACVRCKQDDDQQTTEGDSVGRGFKKWWTNVHKRGRNSKSESHYSDSGKSYSPSLSITRHSSLSTMMMQDDSLFNNYCSPFLEAKPLPDISISFRIEDELYDEADEQSDVKFSENSMVNTWKFLLSPEERSSGSEKTSSSEPTTVKTKRSLGTLQPTSFDLDHSATHGSKLEELTLSLGSKQLSEVLQKLALNDYSDVFTAQDIDFSAFVDLSTADLVELGIEDHSTRMRIVKAIKSLNKKL